MGDNWSPAFHLSRARKLGLEMTKDKQVLVLGAGYSGLTTAAELTLRGFKARVVAADLGYRPPLTIVGTQSRRWPGSAISNTTFNNDDLLDRELVTIAKNTVADCDGVCIALFGQKMSLNSGDGFESWKTDRPMRKEGFNICAEKSGDGLVS